MVVGYGVSVPSGSLPVFSCHTEEEAQNLITLACPLNLAGEYIAPELAHEQTLENLAAFSIRLQKLSELFDKDGNNEEETE